jgi:hypothetical protein
MFWKSIRNRAKVSFEKWHLRNEPRRGDVIEIRIDWLESGRFIAIKIDIRRGERDFSVLVLRLTEDNYFIARMVLFEEKLPVEPDSFT